MARPKTLVSTEALSETVERLLEACASLSQAVQELKSAEMPQATLPWTNAHWSACDKLIEAGVLVLAASKAEIAAHKSNRPSHAARERERAQRDYAKRKDRMAAEGIAPKKRGRPRKTP